MEFLVQGNYLNGSFMLPPVSGANSVETIFKNRCPADLSHNLGEYPIDYQQIDNIIESAEHGFKIWRKTNIEERITYLTKYQELIISEKERIATALALETGRPLHETHDEIDALISQITTFLKESSKRINNITLNNIKPETKGIVTFKPIGPTLIISSYIFPCLNANEQMVAALIAGNSIILKPSIITAYSLQLIIECFHKAGFPKGVVNLIQGDTEISRRLLKEKKIKVVFFTGNKENGKDVLDVTHHDVSKLVSLSLGGKNTCIVHQDANLDDLTKKILDACFLSCGQRYTSTGIVAIHKKIADKFISKFHNLAKEITIEHPIKSKGKPFMGPLIDQKSVDSYLLFMGMAKRDGIEEIMRGKLLEKEFKGHYVSPSIHFSKSFDLKSHFIVNEITGPNCTFIPYDDIEEAITMANSTEFGLISSIFTESKNITKLCLENIECGMININHSTLETDHRLPRSGIKNSGNYRPSAISTIDSCVYSQSTLSALKD